REPSDPLRERVLVVGLDDQVEVVPLDAHVHDAEVLALRGDDRRLAERQVEVLAAQPGGAADDPGRQVHRMPRIVLPPRRVACARTLAFRLASRAPALAAVGPEDHLDLIALHASLAHDPALPGARPPSARPLDSADNLSDPRHYIY